MKNKLILLALIPFITACLLSCQNSNDIKENTHIRIYDENPFYWQYQGKPVLLIGGSREDNLFNHPEGLEEHLDDLVTSGGNYVRNTMSSRNPGNPWAFKQLENGLYDLEQWDEEYWDRFDEFLSLTYERDIIVQIEIWDPWDFFKSEEAVGFGDGNVGWESCPFNPRLNINYTAEETGLEGIIDYTLHTPNRHLFFQTPPELADIPQVLKVLKYQEAFVEKLLSISIEYPNVLYNMRNECRESIKWAQYWARFIRKHTDEAGKEVFLTDMRRSEDFYTLEQQDLLHDRIHFDFIDISQNNHNTDQHHYDQIIEMREQIEVQPIPMNNVKIYGGTANWTGGVEEGTRRYWRNIFAGSAAVRFHREGPSGNFFGIGLNDLAQTHIRSTRMFSDAFSVFDTEPRNDLLSDRASNEAYCLAAPASKYAVYFPNGGSLKLNMIDDITGSDDWSIQWLDISASEWRSPVSGSMDGNAIILTTPGPGHWVAVLLPKEDSY